MSKAWYEGYEFGYLGSESEAAACEKWFVENNPGSTTPSRDSEDFDYLMEDYRETQSWEDDFLDYAWPLAEADGRVEETE